MTVTSYPVESEMSNYSRLVSLQIGTGGTIFFFSPGGSVSISGNRDLVIEQANGQGDFIIQSLANSGSLLIRVDSQIQLIGKADDSESDGISTPPQFDIFEFIADIMQDVTEKPAYLTWRSKTFTGVVKNFNITQKAGEGNLVDVNFTMQVGNQGVPDFDWTFWD